MGDHTAFFYGTLMAPEVLYRVCHGTSKPTEFQKSLLTVKPAVLHSYRRHKVLYCDYPAIVPANVDSTQTRAASVRGSYVTGLTDGDIWRLDIFEGDEYVRQEVEVTLLTEVGDEDGKGNVEGEKVRAQTYVWKADKSGLQEEEWDFGDFVREKMVRWIGGDEEYEGELRPSIVEVDEAVKEKEGLKNGTDPTRGRGIGGQITAVLEEGPLAFAVTSVHGHGVRQEMVSREIGTNQAGQQMHYEPNFEDPPAINEQKEPKENR